MSSKAGIREHISKALGFFIYPNNTESSEPFTASPENVSLSSKPFTPITTNTTMFFMHSEIRVWRNQRNIIKRAFWSLRSTNFDLSASVFLIILWTRVFV